MAQRQSKRKKVTDSVRKRNRRTASLTETTLYVRRICIHGSADPIGKPDAPKFRCTPLLLCDEIERMIAKVVNVKRVMDDMDGMKFTGVDAVDCARQAMVEFQTRFNDNAMNKDSYTMESGIPVYRQTPKGGHETDRWIMESGVNAPVPWKFKYPEKDSKLTVYPCVTILLEP